MITTLQFYVYMNDWNVLYPKYIQVLMGELRRITLGEFIDDFEFGRKIADKFGLKKKPESTE